MRKLEFNIDNKVVDNFVDSIQKQLPQYNVNSLNVNDFSFMLNEKNNCKSCIGLSGCKNSNQGFYMDFIEDSFMFTECKYKKEFRVQNDKTSLINTLYLPKNILNAKLENFNINSESRKKIYNHVIKLIQNFNIDTKKDGLYLYGGFSIGKTFTLGCIANEFAKNNISSLLIYFPDLVVDLKNAISSPRFESLINMLKSIDVLMIDDFGSENMTPWLRDDILGPIINYRLMENKLLFISSNINPNDILAHLSIDKSPSNILKAERLYARLNDSVIGMNMDDSGRYKR